MTQPVDWKLLYETKFAIYGGRLCALTISSLKNPENGVKIRVTSSTDVSIFLTTVVSEEEAKELAERLKQVLSSRTQDPSILGIHVDNVTNNQKFPFALNVDPVNQNPEPLIIPLSTASLEEYNSYLLQAYAREKSLAIVQTARVDELAKSLQAKQYELDALKLRCDFQDKEIQLLRQITENQKTTIKIENDNKKMRRMCGCGDGDESCGSDCEGENSRRDEEMMEDDDDEEEVSLNGESSSTSEKQKNNSSDLMTQLGVIMRAPSTPNLKSSIKIEDGLEKSGPLILDKAQKGMTASKQKEVVVGVVQYVICQLCPEEEQKSMELTNLEEMEAHLLEKHVDKEKKQCEACPTDQFQSNNLAQHMRIHTNSVYACKHCGKRGRKNYLRSHIRTHTGERPYSCDTCSRSFTDPSTLRRHRLVHTGEKKYQCPVCGRAIARKDNVKVHIRSHGINL